MGERCLLLEFEVEKSLSHCLLATTFILSCDLRKKKENQSDKIYSFPYLKPLKCCGDSAHKHGKTRHLNRERVAKLNINTDLPSEM